MILHAAIDEQVVEARHALGLLQPVDDREPAIVADDDDHLVTAENGRIDVRVHHHVGAVADHDDRRAAEAARSGIRHRVAPAGRDLVAHAGEAEFEVERVRRLDAPALGDFAGQAAGRRNQRVLLSRRRVHGVDDLRVGRDGRVGRRLMRVEQRVPFLEQGFGARQMRRIDAPEPSSASSSVTVSRASPTTAIARCFTASKRAALIEMKRASGLNAVQEPVVKSCSRVPTARITSASPASAFAEVEPMMPIGPACAGW